MIKIENYCKPGGTKLLGIPGAFDDEIDGELLPCPLCGRIPKPMVRVDSLDGYFAAVSCFGGKGTTHAYISKTGHGKYLDVLNKAIDEWNNGTIAIYKGKERLPYNRNEQKEENELVDTERNKDTFSVKSPEWGDKMTTVEDLTDDEIESLKQNIKKIKEKDNG